MFHELSATTGLPFDGNVRALDSAKYGSFSLCESPAAAAAKTLQAALDQYTNARPAHLLVDAPAAAAKAGKKKKQ